jgi:hypothetical protein
MVGSSEDIEQKLDKLHRMIPYLPAEVRDRQPGTYPALDAAGPLADQLGHLIFQRSELGSGRWEALAGAVLPVAKKLVMADVGLFEQLAKLRFAERQTHGSLPESALEVLRLFGFDVARNVANAMWQFGYAGCLARLYLETERDKTAFPAPSSDLAAVYRWADAARRARPEAWVNAGTESPLNGTLVLEVLRFVADEEFKPLYPLFGSENQGEGIGRLRELAVCGYALGRAHLEQAALIAIPLA